MSLSLQPCLFIIQGRKIVIGVITMIINVFIAEDFIIEMGPSIVIINLSHYEIREEVRQRAGYVYKNNKPQTYIGQVYFPFFPPLHGLTFPQTQWIYSAKIIYVLKANKPLKLLKIGEIVKVNH